MTKHVEKVAKREEILAGMSDADKAAQLIAEAEAAAAREANFTARREAALAAIEAIGTSEGAGLGARTRAGFLFNSACRVGIMTEADADIAFKRFADGAAKADNKVKVAIDSEGTEIELTAHVDATDVSAKTEASPISRFRNFGRWQVVAQGTGWFARITAARLSIPADNRAGSDYVCLTRASARLCKACDDSPMPDEDVKAGKFTVTDAQLVEWLTVEKKDAAKKSFAEKLSAAVTVIAKLVKENEALGLGVAHGELEKVLGHYLATHKLPENERAAADIKAGFAKPADLLSLVA